LLPQVDLKEYVPKTEAFFKGRVEAEEQAAAAAAGEAGAAAMAAALQEAGATQVPAVHIDTMRLEFSAPLSRKRFVVFRSRTRNVVPISSNAPWTVRIGCERQASGVAGGDARPRPATRLFMAARGSLEPFRTVEPGPKAVGAVF
jgi:hypothetical protein